ncbi:LysR family transcriptional regulator [Pseudonocardia sp. MCCB 268]|nr:LysR family transcriptional regulator [Pseudonocardia cytotoxica]
MARAGPRLAARRPGRTALGQAGAGQQWTPRLQAFMKIVDAGSITRAADILHIAQPALSQRVSGWKRTSGARCWCEQTRCLVPDRGRKTLYRHAQRSDSGRARQADVAVSRTVPGRARLRSAWPR